MPDVDTVRGAIVAQRAAARIVARLRDECDVDVETGEVFRHVARDAAEARMKPRRIRRGEPRRTGQRIRAIERCVAGANDAPARRRSYDHEANAMPQPVPAGVRYTG